MGILRKFSKFFSKDKQMNRDQLAKIAINMYADEKLAGRQDKITELLTEFEEAIAEDEPINYVEKYEARLKDLQHTLQLVSVPFGRAGDKKEYSDIVRGWSFLYHYTTDALRVVKNMIREKKKEVMQRELAEKMAAFIEVEVFPFGFMILGVSYYKEDVSPGTVAVIQSMQPMMGHAGVTPGANRPIVQPRPAQQTFAPTLPTDIKEEH